MVAMVTVAMGMGMGMLAAADVWGWWGGGRVASGLV
jgi:hypothetical protein